MLIEYKEAQEPVQPPVIIAGANGSWQKSGTDGLSFTSNAAFADFIKVQVDGKDLDASNYTVKEGSTIVTLNAAYLNTLSVGKHTLSVVSANGTATTEFTITAAPTGGDRREIIKPAAAIRPAVTPRRRNRARMKVLPPIRRPETAVMRYCGSPCCLRRESD